MNNLNNLYPCLNSIKKYTSINYETIVIAYLFTSDNLLKLSVDYPWIKIIESSEIRGFSENNNIALRIAQGEYSFILNDDIYFNTPVIDNLVNTIKLLPEKVVILSPNILNPDGSIQWCGRPPISWISFILSLFHLSFNGGKNKYTNKKGVFQTYNINGAAFLIKTSIFKGLNFFDKRYFFCPEDIAVSTILNKIGYKCFVNSDAVLYHKLGGSKWSKLIIATDPAGYKGSLIFFSGNSFIKKIIISISIFISSAIHFFYYKIYSKIDKKEYFNLKAQAKLNICKTIFDNKSPKENFIKFYDMLKR